MCMLLSKRYIFIFLLFITVLLSSCSDAKTLFNSGNFRKTISYVESLSNPTPLDIYYQMLSYIELEQNSSAINSAKLFLLMYPEDDDIYRSNREEIVSFIISQELSDDVYTLLLSPSDGLDAQLVLYRSYVNKGDIDNAKKIYEDYLTKQLTYSDSVLLLSSYSFSDSEIIQALLRFASNMDVDNVNVFLEYSEYLLNNSSNYSFNINDLQHFISALTIVLDLSYTRREQKSVCYKLMGRVYLQLGNKTKSKECFDTSYDLNMYDEELNLYR